MITISSRKVRPFAFRLSVPFNVTGTDTDRSATFDFLLVFLSNYGPSEITDDNCKKNSHSVYLIPPLREFPLEFCDGGGTQQS